MALSHTGTTSERHEAARSDDSKITAGQLAKAMRQRGHDVKAAELKEFAPEWHHAGWRGDGRGMGRCYFFPAATLEEAAIARLMERVVAKRAERERPRHYFVTRFRACYDGRHGRKRYQPIAEIGMVDAGKRLPKGAQEITGEQFAALKPHSGEDLEPYESMAAFATRMIGGGE